MNHASLFSGIGGFDLAAQWMGWQNVFQCEKDSFCKKVLASNFPGVKIYDDVKEFNAKPYAGTIDILSGGFPCQPFSNAGERKGTADERHLWPAMLRIIQEVSPRWIVGENVRGLLDWNSGMVFEEICFDLEDRGYEIQPYILPACGVNAPHRRDRIFFIAYSNGSGKGCNRRANKGEKEEVRRQTKGNVPNELRGDGRTTLPKWGSCFEEFPTFAPVCGGDDGIPSELDGISVSKWRRETLKSFGNAVVPQLIMQIFLAIEQYDKQ